MLPLSWGERLNILDALSRVLDGVYVHLPLKRSLYGLTSCEGSSNYVSSAHDDRPRVSPRMTLLMNRLRDAHTQYQGPWRYRSRSRVSRSSLRPTARGDPDVRRVESGPTFGSRPHFVAGVTITHWNGVPFDRAVDLHAESETGGRPDSARRRSTRSRSDRSNTRLPRTSSGSYWLS